MVLHSSCVPFYRNYTAAWGSYPCVFKGDIRAPKSASPFYHDFAKPIDRFSLQSQESKFSTDHIKYGFEIKKNEKSMVAAKIGYWDLDSPKKLHLKVLTCVLFGQGFYSP